MGSRWYISSLISSIAVCSSFVLAYWYYKRVSKARTINRVIFFPDTTTAKRLSNKLSSKNKRCEQSLQEGSLFCLMEALQSARDSLDVCMFTMACRELGALLIRAHQDGIVVRVITDKQQTSTNGYRSQIQGLRLAGIQVRNDNSSYFMHHKFVLVDGKLLINGSLNWTLQGVCGNQENVVLTNNTELVQPFVRHFEHLWDLYDPGDIR